MKQVVITKQERQEFARLNKSAEDLFKKPGGFERQMEIFRLAKSYLLDAAIKKHSYTLSPEVTLREFSQEFSYKALISGEIKNEVFADVFGMQIHNQFLAARLLLAPTLQHKPVALTYAITSPAVATILYKNMENIGWPHGGILAKIIYKIKDADRLNAVIREISHARDLKGDRERGEAIAKIYFITHYTFD